MIVPLTLPFGSFSELVVAMKPASSATILEIVTNAASKPSTSNSTSPLRMTLRWRTDEAVEVVVATMGLVGGPCGAGAAPPPAPALEPDGEDVPVCCPPCPACASFAATTFGASAGLPAG